MTFANLLILTKARCSIVNDTSFDAALKIYLNAGQQNFTTRYLWDFLRQEETVNTAATTETYALASECVVYDVRDTSNTRRVNYVRDMDLDRMVPNPTATGAPYWYQVYGQYKASAATAPVPQLKFYPIPDAAYTIKVKSYKRLSDLVNDTDVSEIPASFHELLCNYAANVYFSSQGDSRAIEQFDLYENGLTNAVEQLGAVPTDAIDVMRSEDDMRQFGAVMFPSTFDNSQA